MKILNTRFLFRLLPCLLLAGCVFLSNVLNVHAAVVSDKDVKAAVKKNIKKKSKMTGKLDIFDADIDKVRNLSFMSFSGNFQKKGDHYTVALDMRDFASGDVVTMEAIVKEDNKGLHVDQYNIVKVKELKSPAAVVKTEYSDQEIQKFMMSYLEKLSKFSGYFTIFDEKKETMLKLKPGKFDKEVRRFGKKFIARVHCPLIDGEPQKTIPIDITAELDEGVLGVKLMRIFRP